MQELNELSRKYRYNLGSCGCCDGTWVTANQGNEEKQSLCYLEWDEKNQCYQYHAYGKYFHFLFFYLILSFAFLNPFE